MPDVGTEKAKPVERQGRKATGLARGSRAAREKRERHHKIPDETVRFSHRQTQQGGRKMEKKKLEGFKALFFCSVMLTIVTIGTATAGMSTRSVSPTSDMALWGLISRLLKHIFNTAVMKVFILQAEEYLLRKDPKFFMIALQS